MPLYEYVCEDCRKDFTLLQPTDVDKSQTACPECGQKNVRHNFSTFAAKIEGGQSLSRKNPVTADDLPNKKVLNLPLPRLRSEL